MFFYCFLTTMCGNLLRSQSGTKKVTQSGACNLERMRVVSAKLKLEGETKVSEMNKNLVEDCKTLLLRAKEDILNRVAHTKQNLNVAREKGGDEGDQARRVLRRAGAWSAMARRTTTRAWQNAAARRRPFPIRRRMRPGCVGSG